MRIGLLSDTHNQLQTTRQALARFKARGIDRLIHCGDITEPKIIKLFHNWDTAFVFGNIDRDRAGLAQAVTRTPGPNHIGTTYEVTLDGLNIAVCHGHDQELLEAMITSQDYDLVCHGHFHRRRNEQAGTTWVVSPGALGGTSHEPRSVGIVDLTKQSIEFINV